jgi:hypothetical protein
LNEPIYTHTRTHTELARLSVVLSELTRHNEDISCLLHGCGGVREARLRGVDWIVRVEHLGVPGIPVSADGCAERYSTSVQQGKRSRPLCKISLAFNHPSLSWSWYVTVLHHQNMASAKKDKGAIDVSVSAPAASSMFSFGSNTVHEDGSFLPGSGGGASDETFVHSGALSSQCG